MWAAKSFLLSGHSRAIHERFAFSCSGLYMLVQKKKFHLQKVSEYKHLLFSMYHIIKTERQKGEQVALILWSYCYSFPPH